MLALVNKQEVVHGKAGRRQMDRRITLSLIGVVVVAALAIGGWVAYKQFQQGGNAASGTLSRYTNAKFGYTLQYPAEWGLNVASEETYMNVYVRLDQGGPGLPGFEITCAANPTGLTAEQWWRSHVSPFNNEAPLGPVTLASGTQAYKSSGEGDQPYELYTMVHATKVCQLVNDKHGTTQVTQQAEAAINSFTWN